MSFPKFGELALKHTLFSSNMHVFAPLNDVRAYIAWFWKTTLIRPYLYFTVKYEGSIAFSIFFYPKIDFFTPKIIWDKVYIEILVVHLSSVHFQLYENI